MMSLGAGGTANTLGVTESSIRKYSIDSQSSIASGYNDHGGAMTSTKANICIKKKHLLKPS